ncbi:MAG TPA: DedA family protein [Acidimicrobiales bacterium]|nr:DedA family protein [Acidimicrobiales bacterium]
MLDSFVDVISDAWWTYPFLFLFALLDSVVPIVPSETAVITAGVAAADGGLNLYAVIGVAAAGAVAGDNLGYEVGKRARPWIERRFTSPKATERLAWARRQLHERGIGVILVARFIPGGRTAVTVTAGSIGMARAKFFFATVVAGIVWASYAALLGYYGGTQFEDSPTKALLLAFGIAFGVFVLTELVRWRLRRRSRAKVEVDT